MCVHIGGDALHEIHFNLVENGLLLNDQNIQSSLEKHLFGFFSLE